jgi:hypothetical protein
VLDYDAAFRAVGADVLWLDPDPDPAAPNMRLPARRTGSVSAPRPLTGRDLRGLEARWWLVPGFPTGVPVSGWKAMCTNARIETAATTPSFRDAVAPPGRCLAPVTAVFEYDAPPGWRKGQPKRRWEVSWPADDASRSDPLHGQPVRRSRLADLPEGLDSFAVITRPCRRGGAVQNP